MIIESAGLVLLAVVAAFVLAPLIRATLRQRAMQRWPQITGFVEAHHVREEHTGTAFLEYRVRYQTQGREFVSMCGDADRAGITQFKVGRGSTLRQEAIKRRLDRYPVGRTIVVMANPANPAEAYIVQRELPLTLIAAAATTILVGFIVATVRILFLP